MEVNALLINAYSNAYSLATVFNTPYLIRKNITIAFAIKSCFKSPFLINKISVKLHFCLKNKSSLSSFVTSSSVPYIFSNFIKHFFMFWLIRRTVQYI